MSERPLRLIFAGTPDFAACHLRALIDSKHQLSAVYSQPDRPAGRGRNLRASPVKQLALEAGLPICQPQSLKDTTVQEELACLEADIMVVVAYGLILPRAVLAAPALGCLNVHASLLPRWRGAAPIQRAIEAGDTTTGITIMQMDEGLDTGDMLATASCELGPLTSAGLLHDRLAELGPPLLLRILDDIETFQSNARVQDDKLSTYAAKISKEEALVDWSLPAQELDRKIRAFNPFPVCFGFLDGRRVRIWRARPEERAAVPTAAPGTILQADDKGIVICCGDGQLAVEELQLEGGRALAAGQVLQARGEQFAPGARFDPPAVEPS